MRTKPTRPNREIVPITRLGKDEMNLVEYPFAALWQKEGHEAVISSEWETRHPISGKILQATWKVMGHPEMGLPNASDERVYLVLMELTREAGFDNQTVFFSRYDLLKRLGWKDDPSRYEMLSDAFKRLQGVKIQADNAFWDAQYKSFRNVGFSLIDVYDILAEKPGRKKKEQGDLPVSYFTWNDVMFASFRNGYLKTLDLGFALALKGDITLRLYRYLDKKSYDGRQSFEIELESLCVRHLGMKPSPYPSKHKERLKPAHDELIAKGFLQGVAYESMKTKKAQKVCYLFAPRDGQDQRSRALVPSEALSPPMSAIDVAAMVVEPSSSTGRDELLQRILDLKVSPDVADNLLRTFSADVLRSQLDCLNDREPKDAAATFVKAVREEWQAPRKYFERLEAAERVQRDREVAEVQKQEKAAQKKAECERILLHEQEAAQLDAVWERSDERAQEQLNAQVRDRLQENEFFHARMQAGKLTFHSPDWIKARREILKEMLKKAKGAD